MKKTNLVFGLMLIMLLTMSTGLMAQNNCLDFDGTGDHVTSTFPPLFENIASNDFTVEFWARIDDLTGYENWTRLLEIIDDGDEFVQFNIPSNNQVQIVVEDLGTQYYEMVDAALEVGMWYHFAATWDASANDIDLYLNGVEHTTAGISGAAPGSMTNTIYLGGRSDGNGDFDGTLDEFRIWNDIRTRDEIRKYMYQEVSASEPGLEVYYKMNETSGTSVDNAVGTSTYDGTSSGTTIFTSPAFFGPKNCLDFNGTDDYLYLGQSSSGAFTKNFTISAWVKPDAISGTFTVIGIESTSRYSSSGFEGFTLELHYGIPRLFIAYSSASRDIVSANTILTTDQWYHIIVSRDDGEVTFYINGEQDAVRSVTNENIIFNSSDPGYCTIGNTYDSYYGTNYFFNGMIDEVRVWNTPHTEVQIRENMLKSIPGIQSGLVYYFNFDSTNALAIADFGGQIDYAVYQGSTSSPLVASTAFNTWLNTDDSAWLTASNWSGGVPISTDNVGIYNYTGGVSPVLGGNPTLSNLVVDDNFTLSSGLTVTDQLIIENDLDLNGQVITLGTSANLIESSGNLYGTSGTIQTTRDLSNIDEDVAGLGSKITEDGNLGITTIIRGHAAQGSNGINRYYQINPTNNPSNATLVFNYRDTELNGITEADLKLFKSSDGNDWTVQSSSSVNTTYNTITLSGIDSFSWWTAGDGDAPLPVNLSAFYALYIGGIPTLYWTTQSEIENAYWNVYRGNNDDFTEAVHLNADDPVPGNGTTDTPSDYIYLDNVPVVQNSTYWYWIESVATDGESEVHDPITLEIPFEDIPDTPDTYGLHQNYPNPFNPSTSISFALEVDSDVELIIYNIKGAKIRTIFTDHVYANDTTSIVWDGNDAEGKEVSSGVYFYKLITDTKEYQKKMLLVK